MSKPDFAFRTAMQTVYATGETGVYRAEPAGALLRLSLERQEVPAALLEGAAGRALERAVAAWVMARGGRTLRLNSEERPLAPEQLDRPPAGPVRRLVSIAPSNAEIVGALGMAHRLVGTESSSDFPPEVLRLPRLGPDLAVDLQSLAALQPDLVLASLTVPGMERNVAGLDALGLPMLVLAPRRLADIRADVLRVGAALDCAERAQTVVAGMDAALADLRQRAVGRPPVRVFLQWWHQPMFTPGAACWSNELIEAAGGVNVFRALPGQSAQVEPDAVVEADPQVIFLSWCGVPFDKLRPERVLRRPELAGVTAIREGRVYPVDEALLGRPGPRVVQGVAAMAEAIRTAAA
ncbi:MAG TPA: cobalamin-binding protein [bacterium]|nr:cobalamin-binding protein [bacterium]